LTNNQDGLGTLFIGGIILVIWIIIQLWYIILPLVVIGIGIYLYFKHDEKKLKKEQERLRQERLRQERLRQERLRQERLRQEKETKRINCRNEEIRKLEEKRLRVEKRLEKFHLNKKEAELIFGKTWKKRFEKPDELLVEEIRRIGVKLTDSDSYKSKVSPIMEKVFDVIDIFIHDIWSKIGDWDDIDFENWEDDWQVVRDAWRKEKQYYQNRKEEHEKENFNNLQKYYDVLELRVGATIKEIKAQYRILMLKFHPDKNNSPGATQKCKKIIHAYNKLVEIIP